MNESEIKVGARVRRKRDGRIMVVTAQAGKPGFWYCDTLAKFNYVVKAYDESKI